MTPQRSRVIIERLPDGNLDLAYEGLPGWGLVLEVLLKAAGEAGRQAVLEDRQRRDRVVQVPLILLSGTGEQH